MEGRKARKLDRVLCNEVWLSCFPLSEATFLAPGSSDHSPMFIRTGIEIYRRKVTFCFFKMWAENPDFEEIVRDTWSLQVAGSFQYQIAKKLKLIKERLKTLNQNKFRGISDRSSIAKNRLLSIQQHLDSHPTDKLMREQEKLAL